MKEMPQTKSAYSAISESYQREKSTLHENYKSAKGRKGNGQNEHALYQQKSDEYDQWCNQADPLYDSLPD
ncbi:hypothetical protein ACFLY2_01805 [Patescibacteria group bacterium]